MGVIQWKIFKGDLIVTIEGDETPTLEIEVDVLHLIRITGSGLWRGEQASNS
jgi:hypothetical protein